MRIDPQRLPPLQNLVPGSNTKDGMQEKDTNQRSHARSKHSKTKAKQTKSGADSRKMREVSIKFEFSEDEEGLPLMGFDSLLDQIEQDEQVQKVQPPPRKHEKSLTHNEIDAEDSLAHPKAKLNRARMQPTELIRCQNKHC